MWRVGPYNASIKKRHVSNSEKSMASPITEENCIMSQLAFPWGTKFIHRDTYIPTRDVSRAEVRRPAFLLFLSANNLDGKHVFILGKIGKNITRSMSATLYRAVTAAGFFNMLSHLDLKDYRGSWMSPSHLVQRPPGEQVDRSGLQARRVRPQSQHLSQHPSPPLESSWRHDGLVAKCHQLASLLCVSGL